MMKILDSIKEHKLPFLIGTLVVLILILLLSLFILIGKEKAASANPDDIIISLDPAVFILPDEPLELPPIQYSRKQKKQWTETDIDYWYTIPDAAQMKKLHDINEEKMNKLWESVP